MSNSEKSDSDSENNSKMKVIKIQKMIVRIVGKVKEVKMIVINRQQKKFMIVLKNQKNH